MMKIEEIKDPVIEADEWWNNGEGREGETRRAVNAKAKYRGDELVSLEWYAECPDEPDAPTLWRDMTPEEKGALLLAEHEGKGLEFYNEVYDEWRPSLRPIFHPRGIYRIKPEPKRETVTLYGHHRLTDGWVFGDRTSSDTHRLTFDTIDGEPVPGSENWEKLDE